MTADAVSEREQQVLDDHRDRRARKRPQFKDAAITMAHGAGGKATQTLIEGLFVARLRRPRPVAAMADAGAVGDDLAMTTDSLRGQAAALPRRLDRRARGQRHRQRPRGRGRAPARADARDDPRGGARRRRRCAPRSTRSPPPPRAAGVEIVAGDTKVVERGHADGMYLVHHRRRRARPARDAVARRACGPATACSSRARSASTAPRSCSRAASSSSTAEIESDTRSLWPAVDALLDAAGPEPALHARRHARRRRLGAQRARARLAAWR